MNSRMPVPVETLLQTLVMLVGAVVGARLGLKGEVMQAGVAFLVALVLVLLIHFWGHVQSAGHRLLYLLGEIGKGILWFFAGNYFMVEKLYYPLITTIHSSLLAVFFQIDTVVERGQQLYIVFTHRPMWGQDEESLRFLHNQLDENYQIAPYPVDEAPFIMKTWHYLASVMNLRNIHLLCACQVPEDGAALQQNLIVLGSNRYNNIVDILQSKAVQRNWLDYIMLVEKERRECYLAREWGPTLAREFRPTRSTNGNVSVDYGLVIRMPNPLNPKTNVFVFAGCHRAGQMAITEWFFKPEVLMALARRYAGSTPFQLILEQEYVSSSRSLTPILKGEPRIVYEKSLDRVASK
jgi:hypothetical protein